MTKIRAILVAALLALLTPSLAQAQNEPEYCYTEYRFIGWFLIERHVCVAYSGAQIKGPWVQYQF
jgi:hypothetical protein